MTLTGPALILEAARVAADAHRDQTRKGTSGAPYIGHPIAVARMVAETTEDPEILAAALLHDVVEDSGATIADIRSTFGNRVAGIVEELTDPPETADWPRPARKARQAEHMKTASREARLVKIADQTANLEDLTREPAAMPPEGHDEYRAGALRVVEACRDDWPDAAARFDAAARAHAAVTGGAEG